MSDAREFNSLAQLLRDCRMAVCESYYYGGPAAALVTVAEASVTLAPLVADGDQLAAPAWDSLQEVAENLTLVRRYGQDAVQEAMAFGPRVYAAHKAHATSQMEAA